MISSHSRRDFLKLSSLGLVGVGFDPRATRAGGDREVLYNGIVLGQPWPPQYQYLSADPITPPYLDDPPEVINIDVGRQLFVDDFLIEETTLKRTWHHATYHPASPVLRPQTEWERQDPLNERQGLRLNPAAMPFSDGVFWDPAESRFRMWYMGGYNRHICHAVSDDGVTWTRPSYDVVPGTNIVLKADRDSTTVWLDHFERDPKRRFKAALFNDYGLGLYASADGLHWQALGRSGRTSDRTTFFYNAFRRKWVFSLRGTATNARVRFYREHADWFAGSQWRDADLALWAGADRLDTVRPGWATRAELYNLDAVSYESVLLGLFSIWRGEPREREKINEVCLGFSRDGFHWIRPDRSAFIGVSDHVGDWNWANVQSAGGGCLVVGDRLYFYVSGRSGVPGTSQPGRSCTGLALLRRDGFASMDRLPGDRRPGTAVAGSEATLTTRVVRFNGLHLFVNADLSGGELRVELLDADGRAIPAFSRAQCEPVSGDGTRLAVRWRTGASLQQFSGQPVRFRFSITAGRLFAFWVSPSTTAASFGYVAAGGPGLPGAVDTVGGNEAPPQNRRVISKPAVTAELRY